MAHPAFPWPVWTAAWLWSMPVARVSHWGTQRGAAGLGGGFSTARAARQQQSSPERGAWAPRVRQGLRHLAQRGLGELGVLTHCLGRPELQQRDVGSEFGGAQRRRLTGARGGGAAGLAPASDLLNKARGRAANENRRSDKPESHRRRRIARNELTCGGGSAAKSGADEDWELV